MTAQTTRRGFLKWAVAGAVVVAAGAAGIAATRRKAAPETATPAKPRVMKISHQWSTADIRHIWAQKFAQMVEERTEGAIKFEIYPAKSLYKPVEQWDYLVTGDLEFTIFPLDYASGKAPEVSITLMPAMITSLDHGLKWRDAEIGKRMEKILEGYGVKIVSWGWFTGGIGSKPRPIVLPEDVKGLKMRAAGKMFEYMLAQAGASIVSMPSSELYTALQTGVLDACLTSTTSFDSYKLYEVLQYYTGHRKGYMIWYMLEPFLMSMKVWNTLTPEQQKVIEQVGRELETWLLNELKTLDDKIVNKFEEKGLKVHDMTKDEWEAWRDFAQETAWKHFAEKVPAGKELIELALKVKP